MRIGTANLDGRWSQQHQDFLDELDCEVWLLTEVSDEVSLDGFNPHRTAALMAPGRSWAAVLARESLEPEPDPHRATASARVGGLRFMSSVLPWRSCGPEWPGDGLARKTEKVLEALAPVLSPGPLVWGGDWNQALEGPEFVGTIRGRELLIEAVERAGLVVPTASLPSASPGHQSIDHIAVSARVDVRGAWSVSAIVAGRRLSDHDAYVVDLELGL